MRPNGQFQCRKARYPARVFDSLSVNTGLEHPDLDSGVNSGVDSDVDPGIDRDPGVEAMRTVRAGMATAVLLDRAAEAQEAMASGFDLLADECPECSMQAERQRQQARWLREQATRCREQALDVWIVVERSS
jgi:hypothetical protein